MARIELRNLRHSYQAAPGRAAGREQERPEADWALKRLDLDWEDGGAYALLGPSGCGKTTLLNIISGLLRPSEGRVLFDGRDVTDLPPDRRQIAQVFQFPVVYDTMTVYDNLAFPLRNRGMKAAEVDARVREVAEMIHLSDRLKARARGLTADGKQKISLGRGLVRTDVNAILFDEPLTVIDPHLKWQLRSNLKELHQRVRLTMIYVTHDQTEALTFADRVVVMNAGQVVQTGTPVELFERPAHTFVGHFIGSPGMNLLPGELQGGQVLHRGRRLATAHGPALQAADGPVEIGVRPEFVEQAAEGLPAAVTRVDDAGRYRVVSLLCDPDGPAPSALKMLLPEERPVPDGRVFLRFDPGHTLVYRDGWLLGEPRPAPQRAGGPEDGPGMAVAERLREAKG